MAEAKKPSIARVKLIVARNEKFDRNEKAIKFTNERDGESYVSVTFVGSSENGEDRIFTDLLSVSGVAPTRVLVNRPLKDMYGNELCFSNLRYILVCGEKNNTVSVLIDFDGFTDDLIRVAEEFDHFRLSPGGFSAIEFSKVSKSVQRRNLSRFKRDAAICADRANGMTFRELEEKYSLTRVRCRQICDASGLKKKGRGRRPSNKTQKDSNRRL